VAVKKIIIPAVGAVMAASLAVEVA